MKGFNSNIEKDTLKNENFRKVLYTSKHMQLVLMSLKPGEDIGEETHPSVDQFFRFEAGNGKCIIDGNEYVVGNGDVIIVPAGSKHNVINTDAVKELKCILSMVLLTIKTASSMQQKKILKRMMRNLTEKQRNKPL